MKKTILLLFLIFIFGCSDDDNKPSNPIDKLPPATQTGQGTFACLVDGKPFIDTSGYPNNLNFNCFYQYVDGGYYFSIQGKNPKENMRTVILATTNKSITEGEILQLIENQDNNAWGGEDLIFLIIQQRAPILIFNTLVSYISLNSI